MEEADIKRVLSKLDEIDKYLSELEEILPEEKEYLENLVKRRACEKTLELAIEAVLDTASIIVSSERLGLPSSEENIIELLVEHKILDHRLGTKIKEMKGFRNILVHRYGRVNDRLAYKFLAEDTADFKTFREKVTGHLKRRK